jgi:glycosyltransferase involved in cell wall biosynthesis
MRISNRLSILQLGSAPPPYGGESTFVHETSRYLTRRGHVVVVAPLTLMPEEQDADIDLERNYIVTYLRIDDAPRLVLRLFELLLIGIFKTQVRGIFWSSLKVLWDSMPTLKARLALLYRLAFVFDICESHKIDVIIGHHGGERGLITALMGKVLRIQGYPFLHGGVIFETGNSPTIERLARTTIQHGERFLFCSSNSITRAEELGMKRPAIHVGEGVDVERIKLRSVPPLGDKFQVTFVGYLSPHRGLDQLVRASALARDRIPGIRVSIVGDDPLDYWLELREHIQELDLSNAIEYLGRQSRASFEALLQRTHVVALLLRGPKTGSLAACLEAQAAGIPVLSTGLAGLDEYIQDGKTGILCGTSAESASDGLVHIYRGYQQGNWRPEVIRAWAADHSWEQVAREMESAFLMDAF